MEISSHLNILISVKPATYLIKNESPSTFLFLIENQSHELIASSLLSLYQIVSQNTLLRRKLQIKQSGFAAC